MSDAFYEKQARIVSLINQCRAIIEAIHKAHVCDKYSLIFPTTDEKSELKRHNTLHKNTFYSKFKFNPNERRYLDVPHEMKGVDIDEISLGRMLANKLLESVNYLDRICVRVKDSTSKILVTGDVNSGKSTIVNAFLRRSILPIDQQPCTQSFCEVIPSIPSCDQEVVHGITDYEAYDSNNFGTYNLIGLSEMNELIQDERTPYQLFRVFVQDDSLSFASGAQINISIIDSPGLNSDLFKTMSLFSKQEDIDVVIFVINAANHLTLSAREFLEAVGREKSYIFVVVNKFDEIKNKEKCKRLVLAQIKEVLPKTFESPHDLIHFVSALNFLKISKETRSNICSRSPGDTQIELNNIDDRVFEDKEAYPEFGALEASLKQFIFEKRTTSKLLPALTFLEKILVELEELVEYNAFKRREDLVTVENELAIITPCFEELVAHNGLLQADLFKVVEDSVDSIYCEAKQSLTDWNAYVPIIEKAKWRGLLGIPGFLKAAHQRITFESNEFLKKFSDHFVMKIQAGESLLSKIAFARLKRNVNIDHEVSSCHSIIFPKPEIPEFSTTDLLKAPHLLKNSSWISATAIASAFIGYQPLLNLTVRIMDLSKNSGKLLSLTLVFLTGAVGVLIVYRDMENVVRSRLSSHYSLYFGTNQWLIELARITEGVSRKALMKKSSSIVSSFEEALHQQRQICAEKNLIRCQVRDTLGAMSDNLKSIRCLLTSIHDYKLLF